MSVRPRPRRRALLAAPAAVALLLAAQPGLRANAVPVRPPVAAVGTLGNEPIVVAAPDGTLYISALQHLYVSTNGGTSWSKVVTPVYAGSLNLNSDSSIAVDPGNRLYFTFSWPYASGTATCTSDNRGVTWACNPETIPGPTDRMWITAPSTTRAYHVTNVGLYKQVFSTSTDRGATYVPNGTNNATLQPQTGPLLPAPDGRTIAQPVNSSGTGVVLWTPGNGPNSLAPVLTTPLPASVGLPSGGFTPDGTFYVGGETANATGGRAVRLVRTTALGSGAWTTLPPIPGTTSGTATFSAVATGANGDVGVLFYSTPTNGAPSTINATWSVKWARSSNANTASPMWTVTTLESNVHTGHVCAAVSCDAVGRFAGDFIDATIDASGAAHLTWMNDGGQIRYARA